MGLQRNPTPGRLGLCMPSFSSAAVSRRDVACTLPSVRLRNNHIMVPNQDATNMFATSLTNFGARCALRVAIECSSRFFSSGNSALSCTKFPQQLGQSIDNPGIRYPEAKSLVATESGSEFFGVAQALLMKQACLHGHGCKLGQHPPPVPPQQLPWAGGRYQKPGASLLPLLICCEDLERMRDCSRAYHPGTKASLIPCEMIGVDQCFRH